MTKLHKKDSILAGYLASFAQRYWAYMKKVAIIQPSYIPWKGYFDIVHAVDVFVFLDDVQYTKRDWRSRNRIKMRDGTTRWLTVPVRGGREQLIRDAPIDYAGGDWRRKHLEALRHSYGKAPHFERYYDLLRDIFSRKFPLLSQMNVAIIQALCGELGIKTKLLCSTDLKTAGSRDEKLINIIRAVDGDHYLSGPSARDYIRPDLFRANGIELAYAEYSGYPQYPQISEPFEHQVTILDLLFMTGDEAPRYIWGWKSYAGGSGQ